MAQYGLPYMGSKQAICDWLVKIFPSADHFYDLFGGGFSVTHAMLLNRPKDFKEFHYNDIDSSVVSLAKKAIAGDYNYDRFKPKFIDREEYFLKKDIDPYVAFLWSFGNNNKGYLFGKQIEPYKKSMHNAIVFNEFDDLAKKVIGANKFKDGYSITQRRLFLGNRIEYFRLTGVPDFLLLFLKKKQLQQLQQLQQLEQLEQLERLEQLQRLQQLQQLEQLHFHSVSYEQVNIKTNSVIYCDPPYKGTQQYSNKQDHDKFYDWCDAQENPVFISEYNLDDARFFKFREIKKTSLFNNSQAEKKFVLERVYINRYGHDLLLNKIK